MTKQSEQKIIMGIYIFIMTIGQLIGGYLPIWFYLGSTIIFSSISLLNYFAPKISTSTLNPYTIHLAFYCGDKGSLKMRLGQILGFLPVKSLCIVAKDKSLRIKGGVFNIFPAEIITSSSNYLVIDTHVVATDNFMNLMLSHEFDHANKSMASCTGMIKDLLHAIGLEYEIRNIFEYIPSIYLRRILRGRQ